MIISDHLIKQVKNK